MAQQKLSQIRKVRIEKAKKLRDLGINPYPADSKKEYSNLEVVKNFDSFEGRTITLAGRLMSWREHGAIVFGNIVDESGSIQIFIQKEKLAETSVETQSIGFSDLNLLDVGDFIQVTGEIVKSSRGEVSIVPALIRVLGKSIRPLPNTWHGLQDVEERFRKRYLDILLNEQVRERFRIRTKIVTEIRRYLDSLGFMEVETPVLQSLYGGANAKPFKTHLNALDVNMYLRIAPELYLKRLVTAGYEKVYEIAKDFRNEGMDLTHNPEFTMIEYYESYADYNRVMDVTEGLFKHLAKAVYGHTTLNVNEHTIDIGKNWKRISMSEILLDRLNIDTETVTEKELIKECKKNKIKLLGGETRGQLIFIVFDKIITPSLVEPTWIFDYPKDISPLSKDHRTRPGWVERFEGYIGGKEICDGWSELTDPLEQRVRFEADVKAVREDREEAQQVDEDFLEAMEYGMPPMGGIGIGIDRLTMFFTNTWSIKEVIIYPTMRPAPKGKKK